MLTKVTEEFLTLNNNEKLTICRDKECLRISIEILHGKSQSKLIPTLLVKEHKIPWMVIAQAIDELREGVRS